MTTMELTAEEIAHIQKRRIVLSEPDLKFTYHVQMYVPDPRGVGQYFTYEGTVSRETGLNSGNDFDILLQGLAEHVGDQYQVQINPQDIVIQRIELIPSQRIELIPINTASQ